MSRPKPPAAYWLDGDDPGVLVRGVDTFEAAAKVALAEFASELAEDLEVADETLERLIDENLRRVMADKPNLNDEIDARVAELLPVHYRAERIGWWRFNPCNESMCDEGPHTWHLGECSGPGRGRFRGVFLARTEHPIEDPPAAAAS